MSSTQPIDWSSLQLSVPDNINIYSPEIQQSIFEYLSQLNTIQQKTYTIAKNHLGTSFHILRSTGYNEWNKK